MEFCDELERHIKIAIDSSKSYNEFNNKLIEFNESMFLPISNNCLVLRNYLNNECKNERKFINTFLTKKNLSVESLIMFFNEDKCICNRFKYILVIKNERDYFFNLFKKSNHLLLLN